MRAPVAVAYAVKHPDRVSRLLLLGGFHRAFCSAKNPDARVLEEADVPFAEEPAWHTFVAEARRHHPAPDHSIAARASRAVRESSYSSATSKS